MWASIHCREPKTGQQRVQLYLEDDSLCPSCYIIFLWWETTSSGTDIEYVNSPLANFLEIYLKTAAYCKCNLSADRQKKISLQPLFSRTQPPFKVLHFRQCRFHWWHTPCSHTRIFPKQKKNVRKKHNINTKYNNYTFYYYLGYSYVQY